MMWDDATTWRVIVTGGGSGLGDAVCRQLDKMGAAVVALDLKDAALVPTVQVDLSDTGAGERATLDAIAQLGGLDAVVCCAGVDVPGPFGDTPREVWDRILHVNLLGMAAVVRAALPELEASVGRVVTVASTLAHRAVGDATAYCASKFGVVGFTRALAAELKGRIGVTLLTPGGMRTPFFDGRDPKYQPTADAALAEPDDIAESVIWTLSRPAGIEVKELVVMSPAEGSWP
jgi:NAD(P)-dependent dehydrogenase (short-subunit alcohol dehydrogenase family)